MFFTKPDNAEILFKTKEIQNLTQNSLTKFQLHTLLRQVLLLILFIIINHHSKE